MSKNLIPTCIERFQIEGKENQLSFVSCQFLSKDVRNALMYHTDIMKSCDRNFENFPKVKTTIIFNQKSSILDFFGVEEVTKAFIKELKFMDIPFTQNTKL